MIYEIFLVCATRNFTERLDCIYWDKSKAKFKALLLANNDKDGQFKKVFVRESRPNGEGCYSMFKEIFAVNRLEDGSLEMKEK